MQNTARLYARNLAKSITVMRFSGVEVESFRSNFLLTVTTEICDYSDYQVLIEAPTILHRLIKKTVAEY